MLQASVPRWAFPIGRVHRVAVVLALHGFGELVARLGIATQTALAATSAPSDHGESDKASRDRLGARLARVLADLGPTYVKLGQLLATREDVLPPEIVRPLAALHANVPPVSTRAIKKAVREALGMPVERAFRAFDNVPIAAASIGQVHRAVLPSGEEVVVKVQRPGLAAMVQSDLALMRWLAELLAATVPEVASYDPVALVRAFERSMLAELDYRNEATNAARLEALLARADEVRIPRIHAEWTRPTLLVMERVSGTRIDALTGASRDAAYTRLLRVFVRQILEHGVFHADPHPGNVLVSDGKIVLLDFGAVETLTPEARRGLFRLVLAASRKKPRALGDAVVALAEQQSPSERSPAAESARAALDRDLVDLVCQLESSSGAALVGRMVSVSRTHHLRLPASLLALCRALAMLDGVLRTLAPAKNLVRELRREVLFALLRRALFAVLTFLHAARARWMGAAAWRARLQRTSHALSVTPKRLASRPSLSDV
jgi:ubiquinone biosynthesis protein